VQADSQVLGTSGSDRSVMLYDLRSAAPLRKLVLQTATNAMAWNPMEPLNFVVANEDCNLYSYDMRKLSGATCVHEVRAALRATACSRARTQLAHCPQLRPHLPPSLHISRIAL
jgi:hypothetical protein